MHKLYTLLTAIGISAAIVVDLTTPAFAHVIVTPATVQTAAWQTFNVSVPNEKTDPTVNITLNLPAALQHVSPTVKPGWDITATSTTITWSNGSIGVGMRDDFSLSAQVPSNPTTLEWKAYQTYADGTVVSWDQAANSKATGEVEDKGPFSVTHIVSTLPVDPAVASAATTASSAQDTADTALYVAIAGVIVGLVGVYYGVRRHSNLTRKP